MPEKTDAWLQRDIAKAGRWHKLRQRNRWSFVFRLGVIGFGLMLAVMLLLQDIALYSAIPLSKALFLLVFYPAAGILFGFFMWSREEGTYQRLIRDHHKALTAYLASQHNDPPLYHPRLLSVILPAMVVGLYLYTHNWQLSSLGILMSALQLLALTAGFFMMNRAFRT